VKYNLDVVGVMAFAAHEHWRISSDMDDLLGIPEPWDELPKREYLSWMNQALASLDALVKACPEVAQYVMEAPP
jgi:hypothetical protein